MLSRDRSRLAPPHPLCRLRAAGATAPGEPAEIAKLARLYDAVMARNAAALDILETEELSKDQARIEAAQQQYDDVWRELRPLRMRILDLRSIEPAALRLKARVYIDTAADFDWRDTLNKRVNDAVEDEGGPWELAFGASIARDIILAFADLTEGRADA